MNENSTNKKHSTPNILLRNAREQRGWTHRDVADLIHLPDAHTVSRWERGVSLPHPHYRQELCRIFGKSAEELGLIKPKKTVAQHLAFSLYKRGKAEPIWSVPYSFTSFVGREREIATICALLKRSDVRLITLLGPGGIGKTRLSMQVAGEMRGYFAEGTCFVSLAAIRDPAFVLPTLAKGLAIQEGTTLPILEQVKSTLGNKDFLLILDNFEQVLTEATFIEELLLACPNLKVLVTSRAVLHLQVEHEFPLEPLVLPKLKQLPELEILVRQDAIALFTQRAQAVLPNFAVTEDNAQVIAEICMRLDGLPLAIELAAARIKLLSPRALLARLAQPLQILRSELRTVPMRQQALYNTIQWSYDLLNKQEQRVFQRLSVFSGGCTLEVAEIFFSEEQIIDVVNVISSLLDRSLLQRIGDNEQPRFMMLETIREYGLDCLHRNGELEECQRSHGMYYLALLEEAAPHLRDRQQAEWLKRLDQELENMRAAMEWFIAREDAELSLRFCEVFGKFCGLRGYWSEELRWLKAVLALPQSSEQLAIRARVLRRAGYLFYRLRDLTAARVLQEESVELSRTSGDKQNLAGALSGLGWTCCRQKDVILAGRLLQECTIAARESGDSWAIANTLQSLGRFMHYQGNTTRAHQLLTESVALARRVGDKESLARILTAFVSIEISRCDIEHAASLAQEAFAFAQEFGTKPLIALALDRLGDVAMFQGEYKRAEQLLNERLILAQELCDNATIAIKHLQLGNIALTQGNPALATAYLQESLTFFREQGDNPNIVAALDILGDIKRSQGETTQAMTLYKEALLMEKDVGHKRETGKHLIGLAMVAIDRELNEQAANLLGLAETLIKPCGDLHLAKRMEYEGAVDLIRTQLGEQKFTEAWSAGRVMTIDQALALLC